LDRFLKLILIKRCIFDAFQNEVKGILHLWKDECVFKMITAKIKVYSMKTAILFLIFI